MVICAWTQSNTFSGINGSWKQLVPHYYFNFSFFFFYLYVYFSYFLVLSVYLYFCVSFLFSFWSGIFRWMLSILWLDFCAMFRMFKMCWGRWKKRIPVWACPLLVEGLRSITAGLEPRISPWGVIEPVDLIGFSPSSQNVRNSAVYLYSPTKLELGHSEIPDTWFELSSSPD